MVGNSVNPGTQPSREVLAYHEAGHSVVTWALGIPLAKVVVDGYTQYSEIVEGEYKRLHILEGEVITRWKQSLVLVAGGCAQQRQFPEIDFGWEGDHASAIENARRILQLTGRDVWPLAVLTECDKILSAHWHRVERSAKVLLVKNEITGPDAESIIAAERPAPV
jgi:hypothetical protein